MKKSVEEIYAFVIWICPELRNGVLANGYPSRSDDDPISSDVDIALFENPDDDWVSRLDASLSGWKILKRKEFFIVVTNSVHGRDVNVLITLNRQKYMNGILHRQHELMLAQKFNVVDHVQRAKKDGLNTEQAWCKVLFVEDDPHEWMLDWYQK